MGVMEIIFTIVIIIGVIFAGLYFLNNWAQKKMDTHNTAMEDAKQTANIFVIDKKRDKMVNATFPKMVMDSLPKRMKFIKVYMVKAKIGSQIITFVCDKNVYNMLTPKKNTQVTIAGMYIVSVKGMKSKEELKAIKQGK